MNPVRLHRDGCAVKKNVKFETAQCCVDRRLTGGLTE